MTRQEAKAKLRHEFSNHYVMVQVEDSYHYFNGLDQLKFAVFIQPGFVGDGDGKCSMASGNTLDAAIANLLNEREKFAGKAIRPAVTEAEADALFAECKDENAVAELTPANA